VTGAARGCEGRGADRAKGRRSLGEGKAL
jgi:hypothetical protein